MAELELDERGGAKALRALAFGAAGLTLVLITVGGLVTNTDSGLACPDWPMCFGTPFPRMVGGVLMEHGHRYIATAVGLLTTLLAVGALWRQRQTALALPLLAFSALLLGAAFRAGALQYATGHVSPVWAALTVLGVAGCALTIARARGEGRLASLALLLVMVQGLLGGLTVIFRLPVTVLVLHLGTSMLFLGVALALAFRLREATPATAANGPGTANGSAGFAAHGGGSAGLAASGGGSAGFAASGGGSAGFAASGGGSAGFAASGGGSAGFAASGGGSAGAPEGSASARALLAWTTVAVYLQIVLGATVRHTGAGLVCTDLPLCRGALWPSGVHPAVHLHMAHRAFALVVAALALATAARLWRDEAQPRLVRALALSLPGLVVAQIALGLLTISTLKEIVPVTAHLFVGALIFAACVSLLASTSSPHVRADGARDLLRPSLQPGPGTGARPGALSGRPNPAPEAVVPAERGRRA